MKKAIVAAFGLALSCLLSAQPLRLLPQNPHYFQYRGKPLVIVGSGEHYGAVMNRAFDYDKYLKTLEKEGLNTTRLFTGAYYEKPGAFGIEKNTLAPSDDQLTLPWAKTGGKYDLNAWDAAYFERLRDFMQKAARAGIIVEITLFSAYYGSGWAYHPFHGANNVNGTPADLDATKVNTLENGSILKFQEAYVRKLVRELNGFDNFYFEIQNEPWAEGKDSIITFNDYIGKEELKQEWQNWKNTLEIASEKSRDWHKTVSNWIVSEEKKMPKRHLISHNVANFKLPIWASDPNVSIYTFHYAHPDAASLNLKLNKVIGFNETGFAGRSDATYRRQAWRFMFSGGGLFGHLDYSFSVGHEDGADLSNNAPGGGSPALRGYFRVLKNTLQSADLATLKPDNRFLGHVEGAFSYAMKDAQSYFVYLEPLSTKPVKLPLLLPKGAYKAEWIDVLTGKTLKSESFQTGTIVSPSGNGDKLVRIKKLR